jgi:hypothetical protein
MHSRVWVFKQLPCAISIAIGKMAGQRPSHQFENAHTVKQQDRKVASFRIDARLGNN